VDVDSVPRRGTTVTLTLPLLQLHDKSAVASAFRRTAREGPAKAGRHM
jgi:hypothetical protein